MTIVEKKFEIVNGKDIDQSINRDHDSKTKNRSGGVFSLCQQGGCKNVNALVFLSLLCLVGQMDRYLLAPLTKPMAQDLHYGDIVCMKNSSCSAQDLHGIVCNATTKESCASIVSPASDVSVCEWSYNGQGMEYQILAGPAFQLVFTTAGIFVSVAADHFSRKNLVVVSAVFWSISVVLTGFVKKYWQLALLRFALGLGQAGFFPLATSMLSCMFQGPLLSTALGVFGTSIFFGYGLAFLLGNWITSLNIAGQSWRIVWYIGGAPGILLGILVFFTVREPDRVPTKRDNQDIADVHQDASRCSKVQKIWRHFATSSMFMMCLAASVRHSAGYVWGYNMQLYFQTIGRPALEVGTYMSLIPMLAGSASQIVGGLVTDRIVSQRGPNARLLVLAMTMFLAAPFCMCTLLLEPPLAYYMQICAFIFGQSWLVISVAVVVELVPPVMRTTCLALYMFIISNIGGNAPLLVPLLQTMFERKGFDSAEALRDALLVLYPGSIVLSGSLFLLMLVVVKRDVQRVITRGSTAAAPPTDNEQEPLALPLDAAHTGRLRSNSECQVYSF